MNWEQKLAAIQALGDTSLRMRKPGDWYVSSTRMEIGGDGMLSGEYGNGRTPEEAVEEHWRIYTNLPPGKFIVIGAYTDKRRQVRWNGYMWEDIAK